MIQNITVEEGKKLVDENKNNSDFVILDVRTKDEFDSGHLENAVNLDFYSPGFTEKIKEMDKNKRYLVHCQKGGRSSAAVEKVMNPLEFENLYNMEGGFGDWEAKGYQIKK